MTNKQTEGESDKDAEERIGIPSNHNNGKTKLKYLIGICCLIFRIF